MDDNASLHELTGSVHTILETKRVTEEIRFRELWLKTFEDRPQIIKLQAKNDRCGILDRFIEGDSVKVKFFISGKPSYRVDKNLQLINNLNIHHIEKC